MSRELTEDQITFLLAGVDRVGEYRHMSKFSWWNSRGEKLITTMLDVASCSEEELSARRGIGPKTMQHVKKLLATRGLQLGMQINVRMTVGTGATVPTTPPSTNIIVFPSKPIIQVETKAPSRLRLSLEEEVEERVRRQTKLTEAQIEALCRRCDELELNTRVRNNLAGKHGSPTLEFVWQICFKTNEQMLSRRNFARRSLFEVRGVLADMDLCLNMAALIKPKLNLLPRPTQL